MFKLTVPAILRISLVFALIWQQGDQAQADPVCRGQCFRDSNPNSYPAECLFRCDRLDPNPPNSGSQSSSYGAIAIDIKSGAYGFSYSFGNQSDAQIAALRYCRKKSSRNNSCQVATWYHNACGAVAESNSHWGADWGNSKAEAARKALRVCGKYSSNCKITRLHCSF
jgi:hypothetical protein